MRLDATRLKPARQPKAVVASFEGQRNPRDRAAGPDHLIPPAMQQGQQPFWVRLQLLSRLTLNAGKHTANQPARLAQLDHGNDRAIVVQGDEGSAQIVRLGHRGTPSIDVKRRSCHVLAARPIESTGSALPSVVSRVSQMRDPGRGNGRIGVRTTLAAHHVGWKFIGSDAVVYANTGAGTEAVASGVDVMEIHLTGVASLAASDINLHAIPEGRSWWIAQRVSPWGEAG